MKIFKTKSLLVFFSNKLGLIARLSVSMQLRSVQELGRAALAHVPLLLGVTCHVLLQGVHGSELLLADEAFIRLDTSVNHLMLPQVPILDESFSALGTFVRPIPVVSAQVDHQCLRVGKVDITIRAAQLAVLIYQRHGGDQPVGQGQTTARRRPRAALVRWRHTAAFTRRQQSIAGHVGTLLRLHRGVQTERAPAAASPAVVRSRGVLPRHSGRQMARRPLHLQPSDADNKNDVRIQHKFAN